MSAEYRPLIAIAAYHLGTERVARWPHGGYGVPAPYLDAVRRTGARTAILSPGETGEPEELLEPFDGLLLVGGGDVEPSRYGSSGGDHVYGLEQDRDALEIELVRAADRVKIPALCVCRGMQVLNVAFGGTLHAHLPSVPGMLEHGAPLEGVPTLHDVKVAPGSLLLATTGVDTLVCSSHHHQGVDRLGKGLAATGWTDDGLVEAIECDRREDADWDRWIVGVQWHPEDDAGRDGPQQDLFQGLANMARLRGTRAKAGMREGRSGPFAILDPDPAWPTRFIEEANRIHDALGEIAVRIDHVGSTAVQGLPAKDVIDIQVSVGSLTPRATYVPALERIGYTYKLDPSTADHEYLTKGYGVDHGQTQRIHLHVCAAGGEWERRHLAFRDWLRTHPEDRDAYAALKRELAVRHPRDIHTYTDGKDTFIRSTEAKATRAGGDGD